MQAPGGKTAAALDAAIGHPHDQTIAALRAWLSLLEGKGRHRAALRAVGLIYSPANAKASSTLGRRPAPMNSTITATATSNIPERMKASK